MISVSFLLLLSGASGLGQKVFLANDYGAKGDGITLETRSLQKAIDATAAVGGTLTLKPGNYLTGSLFLKSGMTLDLPDGVVRGRDALLQRALLHRLRA